MTTQPSQTSVLCLDLGKTRARAELHAADGTLLTGPDGAPLSAESVGVAAGSRVGTDSAAALAELASELLTRATAGAPLTPGQIRIGAGVAGALTNTAVGAHVATTLAAGCSAHAAATSDVVTAHVGALGGEPGTVLVVGTGAVALGLDTAGALRRVDGWGPELGDLGSGSWLGRRALRRALAERDGTATASGIRAAIDDLTGGADPVAWLAAAPNTARRLASAAPPLLDLAAAGDHTATQIADEAIGLLVSSALAASSPGDPVALLGGITSHAWFGQALREALAAGGLTPTMPLGSAIDGARLVALHTDLPHERHIHRADPSS
ncbi:N-acetylglucosamine kinase [Leucobacter aridicollis]|uniref:N-acetylglucosamine kinase n=1 Tax=Leucobacter aridicollis TaxID=283878 RepID=UPI0013C45217|nr:BadF/BadG/BcrA/BcrD ATPase family protein [Leucobacter aridicollis]UTX53028.1 ATPase [Leucobacter aridicollis]